MKVPLLDVTPPPEFGAVHADERFGDPHGADFDHTYVPGFSDLRRQRDLEIAEVAAGARQAKTVSTLPVNCRWVRCQKANGETDNTKLWTAGQRGYKPILASEAFDAEGKAKYAWLKDIPLGAVKDANGMIRNGDTVLCVASAKDASRNEARKQAQTRSRMDSAEENFRSAVAKSAGPVRGVEPTVETTVSKPSRKEH